MDMLPFLRSDRPLVIGHRGERVVGPENTLEAFERAARLGADGVELDVRLVKSGEVIVLHDEDLARVTKGADTRRAENATYRELREADLGGGARVPILGDALDLARSRGLFVNVEVKRDVPDRTALVRAVARELGRHPHVEIVLSSFDPIMLAGLRALAPSVPTALLIHRSSYHEIMLRVWPLSFATGIHVEHVLFTEARRALLGRAGFVSAWTVNSANDAKRLAEAGARGIITDDPAHVLAALSAG